MSKMIKRLAVAGASIFAGALAAAHAGTVVVPYTGTFDEATGAPGGDYDNIGGAADVGLFKLVAGSNTFEGSIFTPTDSSDGFLVEAGANQTIVGLTIEFGLNLDPFNPLFAAPAPNFDFEESSTTPTIVSTPLGFDGMTSTQTQVFTLSKAMGIYNVLLGNGTFAPNNGGGVDYRVTFDVVENAVPLPAALPLFVAGLAGVGVMRRRRSA